MKERVRPHWGKMRSVSVWPPFGPFQPQIFYANGLPNRSKPTIRGKKSIPILAASDGLSEIATCVPNRHNSIAKRSVNVCELLQAVLSPRVMPVNFTRCVRRRHQRSVAAAVKLLPSVTHQSDVDRIWQPLNDAFRGKVWKVGEKAWVGADRKNGPPGK